MEERSKKMNVLYEAYLEEKRKNEQLAELFEMVDKSLSKHYSFSTNTRMSVKDMKFGKRKIKRKVFLFLQGQDYE